MGVLSCIYDMTKTIMLVISEEKNSELDHYYTYKFSTFT